MSLVSPLQTVLVTTRGHTVIIGKEMLKDNVTATDWHMPVSKSPFLYGICISNESASLPLIRRSKVFVVNFIPYTLKEAAIECRNYHGHHRDKFAEQELVKEEATSIDCPRLAQAVSYLECELYYEKEFGDHVMIIGKVRYSDEKSESPRLFHIARDQYTTTREVKT